MQMIYLLTGSSRRNSYNCSDKDHSADKHNFN